MTAKQLPIVWNKSFLTVLLCLVLGCISAYWLKQLHYDFYLLSAIVFVGISILSLVGTLISGWLTIYLIYLYRKLHRRDPKPAARYLSTDVPRVTIQLPIYNEANVIERLLRSVVTVNYPEEKLQIQVIDDSSDETTDIVNALFEELRERHPHIDFQHLRRPRREGWKAGALNYGLDRASGELIAIFDADFVVSENFLQETVHFFTAPEVGLVQARWAFINRQQSMLTTTQADKLEAHQMFEQTARYWSGRWILFHGTAGIWRKSAIESAGRWSSATDIEDADLSIRALLKDWQFVYLNDLKILSELPGEMSAYLTQQRRWKRGWIKIFQMYWWKILKSRAAFSVRLDMLLRLGNMLLTLMSLIVSTGALPAFILGQRLGLSWVIYGLYTSLLLTSVILRLYEGRTLKNYTWRRQTIPQAEGVIKTMRNQVPYRLLLDMGTLWTWTVGTFEAVMGKSKFERTPKMSKVDAGLGMQNAVTRTFKPQKNYRARPMFLSIGTVGLGVLTAVCIYFAIATEHWISILFYVLQLAGISWVSSSLWSEA